MVATSLNWNKCGQRQSSYRHTKHYGSGKEELEKAAKIHLADSVDSQCSGDRD